MSKKQQQDDAPPAADQETPVAAGASQEEQAEKEVAAPGDTLGEGDEVLAPAGAQLVGASPAEDADGDDDSISTLPLARRWRSVIKGGRQRHGERGRLSRRGEHAWASLHNNNGGIQDKLQAHLVSQGHDEFSGLSRPAFVDKLLQYLEDHPEFFPELIKLLITLIG